jgi:hypothetical protein
MQKVTVAVLAVTGSLLVGPAALAAPVDPAGNVPGYYTPQHAGHDHGKKPNKPRPKPKKPDKHSHGYSDGHHYGHDHGHHYGHHHHDDDSAHASGGYDSHRHHPRHW